jgi:hypothetical protein
LNNRFFGNDPIQFNSSLYLITKARSDDTEKTTCYYLKNRTRVRAAPTAEVTAETVEFFSDWQAIVPYKCPDHDAFNKSEAPDTNMDMISIRKICAYIFPRVKTNYLSNQATPNLRETRTVTCGRSTANLFD